MKIISGYRALRQNKSLLLLEKATNRLCDLIISNNPKTEDILVNKAHINKDKSEFGNLMALVAIITKPSSAISKKTSSLTNPETNPTRINNPHITRTPIRAKSLPVFRCVANPIVNVKPITIKAEIQ